MHIFTDRKHIILDTRSEKEFIEHHIENSVFVGFHGAGFKYWLELLLPDKNIDIEVICDEQDCQKIVSTITGLGYKNVAVMTNLIKTAPLATISSLSNVDQEVLDLRQSDESQTDSDYLPVAEIIQAKPKYSESAYIAHSDSSYRSLIAVSLLKLLGFCKLIYVDKHELEQQKRLK